MWEVGHCLYYTSIVQSTGQPVLYKVQANLYCTRYKPTCIVQGTGQPVLYKVQANLYCTRYRPTCIVQGTGQPVLYKVQIYPYCTRCRGLQGADLPILYKLQIYPYYIVQEAEAYPYCTRCRSTNIGQGAGLPLLYKVQIYSYCTRCRGLPILYKVQRPTRIYTCVHLFVVVAPTAWGGSFSYLIVARRCTFIQSDMNQYVRPFHGARTSQTERVLCDCVRTSERAGWK